MARVLSLTGPRSLTFSTEDHERSLRPGEIRLRGVLSGISRGTEMNLYRGTSPFDAKRFDPELRVFVPNSEQQHAYPLRLGYEMVAEVAEVGAGITSVAVGDLVHSGTPHQDGTIVDVDGLANDGYPVAVLPPGCDPRPAIFVSILSVALQAVHDARVKVGDAVVVSGLGAIGLLVVQLAVRSGAERVIALDPLPDRRLAAESMGAVTIDPTDVAAVGALVKETNSGLGVDVAIETSGVAAGLHGAIASVVVGGRVVSVGYYQGEAVGLRLGEEWHHNRPTMVSSMGVWGCPHRDHPAWHRQRVAETTVGLLYNGAVRTERLISGIVPFGDAVDVYRALDEEQDLGTVALAYPGFEHLVTAGTRSRSSEVPSKRAAVGP